MLNPSQADFINAEEFDNNFYYDYLHMLKIYSEKEIFDGIKFQKSEDIEIDYNVEGLPF